MDGGGREGYQQLPSRPSQEPLGEEQVHRFTLKKALFLLIVVAFVALLVEEHDNISQGLNEFVQWCGKLGPLSSVMIAMCIATVTLFGIPSCPLFIGAGVIFVKLYGSKAGTCVGIASACAGVWLGSMLAFLLGRSVLKPMVQKKLQEFKTMAIVNKIIEKEGWKFAFLMRLSPFLPAEVFNYACSVTSMTVAANCLACVGSLPTTAFWVWTSASATSAAGAEEGADESQHKTLIFMSINIVVIIMMVLLVRAATKLYNKYAEQIEEEEQRQHMQRGKLTVMNDLRKLSPSHKVAQATGAYEMSQWAAAKLRRDKMLRTSTSTLMAVTKLKKGLKKSGNSESGGGSGKLSHAGSPDRKSVV